MDNIIKNKMKDALTSIEEILETVEAVQGKKFADLIRFVLNNKSAVVCIQMIIEKSIKEKRNILIDDMGNKQYIKLTEALVLTMSANTYEYAESLGFEESKLDEAVKFVDVIADKMKI